MGQAFNTGMDPIDWIFLCQMLIKQGSSDLVGIVKLSQAVSSGKLYFLPSTFFGTAYSCVICDFDVGFNYVSVYGTSTLPELLFEIGLSTPFNNPAIPGLLVSSFAISAQTLIRSLATVLQNGKPTVFAGHSLGGAVAQIAAQQGHLAGMVINGIYTIGSPKPGNPRWAENYPLGVINVEAFGDIVPSVPFSFTILKMPWYFKPFKALTALDCQQTGTLLLLDDGGNLFAGGYQRNVLQVESDIETYGFSRHYLTNYLASFSFGHPQTDELLACSYGYAKPWRVFLQADPIFPPSPPALKAPCFTPAWTNVTLVRQLNIDGTWVQLSTVPTPPPTFPPPSAAGGRKGQLCCPK